MQPRRRESRPYQSRVRRLRRANARHTHRAKRAAENRAHFSALKRRAGRLSDGRVARNVGGRLLPVRLRLNCWCARRNDDAGFYARSSVARKSVRIANAFSCRRWRDFGMVARTVDALRRRRFARANDGRIGADRDVFGQRYLVRWARRARRKLGVWALS